MSEIDEIPERIFRMASDALTQANTHAIFDGPGVEHWANMSILDAAHAGELFLKAVIAQAHPLLIFRDIFSLDKSAQEPLDLRQVIEHGRTYNLEHLPKLLWVVHGERLPDLDSFEELRKARNAIQHFCAPDIDRPGDLSLTFLYRNIDPLINPDRPDVSEQAPSSFLHDLFHELETDGMDAAFNFGLDSLIAGFERLRSSTTD